MRFWVKRREEIIPWEGTNLTMAQKIITQIKAHYRTGTNESLTRLADLGLAPELDICDWIEELLKGHPDFVAERGTGFAYPTVLIGRQWAESDIVVRIVDRVLNAEGDTEVTKISLGYLDAHGMRSGSGRYSWSPSEIRIGAGNLGIARGIVKLLEEYFSRKAAETEQ
jgi:hypothetical protein